VRLNHPAWLTIPGCPEAPLQPHRLYLGFTVPKGGHRVGPGVTPLRVAGSSVMPGAGEGVRGGCESLKVSDLTPGSGGVAHG
jgi:hypothetical protein